MLGLQILLVIGSIGLLVFLPERHKKHSIIPFIVAYLTLNLQNVNRTSIILYASPILLIIFLIVALFFIKKDLYILKYLFIVPLVTGFMLVYYNYYTGVINPQWPLLITAFIVALSIYISSGKKFAFKLAINCIMVVILVLTLALCLPTYTSNEAIEKISNDLAKDVSPAKLEPMSIIYSVPRVSFCVDYLYVFEVVENGTISTYGFNPENGEWSEWYTKPIN